MIDNEDLFDAAESDRRKREGMAIAADASSHLDLAREIAIDLARAHGEVHADMVIAELNERHGLTTLGNAAGSLFRGKHWKFSGRRVKSSRKHAHCNELKVWQLNDQNQ